ncbi:MAG: class I SAM-dependent methyltransferase [Deferrisomatales bacterium]|nr:class I SAM-dependent methyltransferase [Deferrisomatales bacterium]
MERNPRRWSEWDRRHGAAGRPSPDPWLVSLAPILGAGLPGPVLDLACGLGQNTLWAASLGLEAVGVDASEEALRRAREEARRRGVPASFQRCDLEGAGALPVIPGGWGAVLVFRFLHRPLLRLLPDALAPGGLLAYRTHLRHPLRGEAARPRRAAFLLEPGELLRSAAGLVPLEYREWGRAGDAWAALLARRPGAPAPYSR